MQEMAFPCFKFQTFSGVVCPHTRDHCYPLLISNDKLWLIFFNFYFVRFFFFYFKYKYIVSINFRANLNVQNAGNCISVRGMLATRVAFSHCYPPLIYYLTERSQFKKCPPPSGKSLKRPWA
jgi:hypothetical protein